MIVLFTTYSMVDYHLDRYRNAFLKCSFLFDPFFGGVVEI